MSGVHIFQESQFETVVYFRGVYLTLVEMATDGSIPADREQPWSLAMMTANAVIASCPVR